MEGLALSRAVRKLSQTVRVECSRRQKRLGTEMTGLKTENEAMRERNWERESDECYTLLAFLFCHIKPSLCIVHLNFAF